MKYLFTIGIVVCDKDFQYVENLLSEIENKVSGKYNVIIYNNCEINYDALFKFDSRAIVLNNTYKYLNARQLYARKMITEAAWEINSDYIWFIDADDLPLKVDLDKLDTYSDIIVFPYNTERNEGFSFLKREGAFKIEKTQKCFSEIGNPLWCKFIKTSILKKAYDLIDAKNLPPISCSEDTLAGLLCLKFAETYSSHCSSSLYFNKNERGDSNNHNIHLENIKNCTIGIEQTFEMLDSLFTEDEKKSFKVDKIRFGIIFWILNRICFIEDSDEKEEALKFLNSSLSDKYKDEYLQENG